MGLEIVELVMIVEEAFEIAIDDEDAEKLTTAGALHDYVLAKVGDGRSDACVSSRAFFRTRRSLMDVLGVPRDEVYPDRALEKLFPTDQRRSVWDRFRETLGLAVPALERPRWLTRLMSAVALMVPLCVAVVGFVVWGAHDSSAVPLLLLGGWGGLCLVA